MRRYILWCWLSAKRLLKKPLFLCLLLLMVLLSLCYRTAAGEDSGMVSVALAVQEGADVLAQQVMERLKSEEGLIRYTVTSTEEARLLVAAGKVDAAWIFPENLSEKLAYFLQDRSAPAVEVLQREENVLLRLSRERLSGAIFECCAEPVYLEYLREHAPQLERISDVQLVEYLTWFRGNDRLFAFEQLDGTVPETVDYLLSPLRGLFGVLIVLCALAAAMYFMRDQSAGMFHAVPLSGVGIVEFGSQLAALWSVSLTAMLCLGICGLLTSLWREMAVTVLYLLCCASFAMLLRRLCRRVQMLAGLLPVLTAVMLVACPVFVEIPQLRVVQYLLPPTYYLQAVYSERFLMLMPVYTAVCFLGCIPFKGRR